MSKPYRSRFVLYMDLLGFSEHVLSIKGPGDEKLLKLNHTLEKVGCSIRDVHSSGTKKIEFRFLSDSVFMVTQDESRDSLLQLLFTAQDVCCNFLEAGFLVRGGLALGKASVHRNIVIGDAVVRAVKLEENVARYPRIVLGRKAAQIVDGSEAFSKLLERAKDGPLTLNYLSLYSNILLSYARSNKMDPHAINCLERTREICEQISNGLERNQDNPKVFEKFSWLRDYYAREMAEAKQAYGSDLSLPSEL